MKDFINKFPFGFLFVEYIIITDLLIKLSLLFLYFKVPKIILLIILMILVAK